MHTMKMDEITVHFNSDLSGELFLQKESDEIKMTFDTLKEIVLWLEKHACGVKENNPVQDIDTISIDSLIKIIHAVKGDNTCG